MYRLIKIKEPDMPEITSLQRIEDMAFIPMDLSNTDYQAYLKWLEEGNEPLPADGE